LAQLVGQVEGAVAAAQQPDVAHRQHALSLADAELVETERESEALEEVDRLRELSEERLGGEPDALAPPPEGGEPAGQRRPIERLAAPLLRGDGGGEGPHPFLEPLLPGRLSFEGDEPALD